MEVIVNDRTDIYAYSFFLVTRIITLIEINIKLIFMDHLQIGPELSDSL